MSKLGNNLLLVNLTCEAAGSLCYFDNSSFFCMTALVYIYSGVDFMLVYKF